MFDPYRKWLGIQPKDQPPNYYRLLSLELFESDLDVIEGAADRQMSFVRQYQSGEHAADAARILNELATARRCLLTPAKKAAYDDKLRRELAVESSPEDEFLDLTLSDDDLGSDFGSRKRRSKSGKSNSNDPSLQRLIGIGVGAAICVSLVIVVFRALRSPAIPNLPDTTATTPTETKPVLTATLPSTKKVGEWVPTKLVADPAGSPIDLLKQMDLTRDVAAGTWEQTTTALIGPGDGKVYLPAKIPEDYQLKFNLRRLEGDGMVALGFIMGGRLGLVGLDVAGSTVSGLYIDDTDVGHDHNATNRRGVLFRGQSQIAVVMTIHPGHLHVTCDGKTIIDWFGDPRRLYLHPHLANGSRESPVIAIGANTKCVVESAALQPIKPERPATKVARLDQEIDVLPLVDLDRDVIRGVWGISKGTLSSPDSGRGRIYLPTVVPEEYTLSTTVELPEAHQGAYTLVIGLVAGKSQFQFVATLDSTALDMIDGRRWNGNETRLAGPLLKPGVPAKIDSTVSKKGVRVDVDGKTAIDWRGDVRGLSLPQEWAVSDQRRLYLGAGSHLKFREVKLGPAIPAPKASKHPPLSEGSSIDLLALVDPARDAIAGDWEREGTALRCRGNLEQNKLVIPIDVPEEYKLTVRVTRAEGGSHNDDCLVVELPSGPSKAEVLIDGYASTISGVSLDGKDFNENSTTRRSGPVIPAGSPREIVYEVKKNSLRVTSEGTTVIDWKGNPERLASHPQRVTPGPRVSLGSWHQGWLIDKIELEPLPASKPIDLPSSPVAGKLMSLLSVERDGRIGDWKLHKDGLTNPMQQVSRFRIPFAVPERYSFSTTVERLQGQGDLLIGLNVGGYACSVNIDGPHHWAGIDTVDGRRYFDSANLAMRQLKETILPVGQRVPIRCVVTPDTVVVTCGNHELIRWHGDPRRLGALHEFFPANYGDADRNQLWVGAWESSYVFRELQLKPLSDTEADRIAKSFTGVFPTTSQANVPLSSETANAATTDNSDQWLLNRKPDAPALLVMAEVKDQAAAIQACRQARLPFELYPEFPPLSFDLSKYSMMVIGTNMMDYWAAPDRKDPAAFRAIAKFINGGGHLLVFNTYTGRNMEHLIPFGVKTGPAPGDTFDMVPDVSEIVFDGAEELIPAKKSLKQAGSFTIDKPHLVLLRRGPGGLAGEPVVATMRHGKGRLTYSSVQPIDGEPPGFWLMQALIRWGARGAPVTTGDLAKSIADAANNPKPDDRAKLEILEAKYGINDNPIVITSAVVAAAKSGRLVMAVDSSLIGGDPKFGTAKYLFLRYRLNGIEEFQKLGENRPVVLGTRNTPVDVDGDEFKLVEVRWSTGLYHPTNGIDVTKQFKALIQQNGLNPTRAAQDQALSALPDPKPNVPKSLFVHYQYQGEDRAAVFPNGALIAIGDPPAKKE